MLSIAIFSECYHPMRNGVVVSVDSFTRKLTEMGHEVTIFTARHPDQKTDEIGVYRVASVTFPTRARYPLAIPHALGKERKMMRSHHFDLIHTHTCMSMGQIALRLHRQRKIPLVFTYHTLMEEYAHYVPLPQPWVRRGAISISREFSNSCDHIITPTEHVASRLRRYRVTKPITVIPTGIDIDMFDDLEKIDIRSLYNIPRNVPLLSYAGRVAKEKNIPRLLSAFREVLKKEPDAHLLIVGGGPDEHTIRHLCDKLDITHRTRMTGFVPRELLMQALYATDIFVFASKTETQGLVLGEAMSCNIPVVAVDADATKELIETGKEGLLVADNDTEFATAVLSLIANPPLQQEMGHNARLRAESISASRCSERLLEVYYGLLPAKISENTDIIHRKNKY